MFRVELPIPPSLNNGYPTNWATKRRYPSKALKEWKAEAGWLVKAAHPPRISGPYTFRILVNDKMRGDADSRGKFAQDLLVKLGVTPDDKHATDSRQSRDPAVPKGRCVVIIESAE